MTPRRSQVTGPPAPGGGAFEASDAGEPRYVMALPEGGSVAPLKPADRIVLETPGPARSRRPRTPPPPAGASESIALEDLGEPKSQAPMPPGGSVKFTFSKSRFSP